MIVDGDVEGRADLGAALAERFGRHYDVRDFGSVTDATAALEQCASDGEEVALVLVALPLVSDGAQAVLDDSRSRHPHAKRVVVIGWDDKGNSDVGATILDADD